ncbi:ATP-binding cassette domain-containing protein [Psychroflexus sp. ALD_RP9]|uniref:ATP-binding cassette domain-containing protein n=1 Tax=Psychroflexus sp. ALD_RP9 TaxID=2777186 RepID=UPI001A90A998|nr:ATP-binding cassette domain-containing protein [Psychroflexus sp. ALD_RP9]QSS97193.1 ATP-binding cassette domain-containing protein [Psychroflexus sp. ALD_RP9]
MNISISNLNKSYGHQQVLKNINLKIHTGEIVGLLGPNGAGKSTLMKLLTGYLEFTDGTIHIGNFNLESHKLDIQKHLGYLPEQNPLYEDMYVREFLQFNASIFKISKKRIKEVIKLTQLSPEANKKIHQLSKGYKQRVGIAAALLHDPEILILDEPTTGLDPNQLIEIRSLIKNISKHKTILLSTHIMQEVEAICDRVVILNKGEILRDSLLQELNQDHQQQVIEVEFNYRIEEVALQNLPALSKISNPKGFIYKLYFNSDIDKRSDVFDFAYDNGLKILNLKKVNQSLEDIFTELTQQ